MDTRTSPRPSAPEKELKPCDLVMKGGVTSGIVYPPLVIKLKDAYRFCSVGGTSAGAMAAAATAAAERGREHGGFEKLAAINDRIVSGDFLARLFQPSPSTRPLFATSFEIAKRRAEKKARDKAAGVPATGPASEVRDVAMILASVLPETHPERYQSGGRIGLLCALGVALVMALFASAVFYLAAGLSLGFSAALRPSLIAFAVLAVIPAIGLAWPAKKLGGLLSACIDLYKITTDRVPGNYFGVCSGRPTEDHPAITDWLGESLNDMAGLDPKGDPLTFGDLWKTRDPHAPKAVDLRMVTSNVSQHQPYVLPFKGDLFIFKRADIEALFPKKVADFMVERSRRTRGFRLPDGYFFLPAAADLPVLFAARMSLSFPVLISMIPLYTISHAAFKQAACFNSLELESNSTTNANANAKDGKDEVIVLRTRGADGVWSEPSDSSSSDSSDSSGCIAVDERHLQINWFSDGGICSNFPIHFFDAWLPTRPTFGVNLTTQLADAEEGDRAAKEGCVRDRSSYAVQRSPEHFPTGEGGAAEDLYARDVYLPPPDGDPSPAWRPIHTLTGFLGAAFKTAQEFRDNMQSTLPSYRERIVQVRLTDEEGGVNLNMPTEVIKNVVRKGASAGELLKTFDLPRHQWVRFRVLMAQMESGFTTIRGAMKPPPDGDGSDYRSLLTLQGEQSFPYHRDPDWTAIAGRRLDQMSQLLDAWSLPIDHFGAEPRPSPEPLLRVTPEI